MPIPDAVDPGDPLKGAERLVSDLSRARQDLADLESEFAALADPDVVALDDEHDSEGSTVGYERARVAGLIERTRRRIADLLEAQRRFEEGTYGRCEMCGGQIPHERLAVLPSTRRCVGCASK